MRKRKRKGKSTGQIFNDRVKKWLASLLVQGKGHSKLTIVTILNFFNNFLFLPHFILSIEGELDIEGDLYALIQVYNI